MAAVCYISRVPRLLTQNLHFQKGGEPASIEFTVPSKQGVFQKLPEQKDHKNMEGSFMMKFSIAKKISIVVLSLLFPAVLSAQHSDVILQGFYWNSNPGDVTSNQGVWWDSLTTAASDIAGAGFQTVWTPPATKGFAGVHDMGYGLTDYFDLGEFNQAGTIRTRHGSRAQLDATIAALHNAGLKAMADIVLNHRGGAAGQQLEDCDDGNGRQLRFTDFQPVSGRLPADSSHFHPTSLGGHCNLDAPFHERIFFEDVCYFNHINNILDPMAANNGWFFGPHNLGAMGDSLVVWGRWLIDEVGFDEVRLDAVKHIEPGFLAPFLVELANGTQPFAVGEFFDGNLGALKFYQEDVERFVTTFGTGSKNANFAIFDFNLRFALRDLCNNTGGGFDTWSLNFTGLKLNPAGGLAGEDIVTFVENHDTDRIGWQVVSCLGGDLQIGNTCLDLFTDGGHDPVISDKHIGYAYIMAAEGRPSVFWKDWYWYHLEDEIKWQMAMRRATAVGGTTPVANLNPFSPQGLVGDDLFALRRNGTGTGSDGAMLMLNDDPSNTYEFFLDSPSGWANGEVRDYSDAYLFQSSQVFNDGRALYKSGPRNYAWFAPTGLYPHPTEEPASSFTIGNHVGAKLHYVVLRAADVNNFTINGDAIEAGDEIAILHTSGSNAVGLGRIGQSFRWDGVHDMIIEVLGGSNAGQAKGGLLNGNALRLAVFDQSTQAMSVAASVTFAPSGANFTFAADRPASRGGAAPFNLTTNNGSGNYSVGGISLVTAFQVQFPDINAAPNAHDYGNVTVGSSASQTFVISNTGQSDLQVTVTSLTGTDAGEFAIDNGGGAFTLTTMQNRNVEVSFNPTSAGAKNATLRFESDDPDENPLDVTLIGNGVEPVDPTVANTVVFATNSVWLKQSADILSGHVLVNDASPGPVLDAQVELSIGQSVTTAAGFDLKAHRIKVKQGASVASDVYYNQLTNNGTITGALSTPLALPILSTLPPFESAPAGTVDIEIAQNDSISLAPGNYRDIIVRAKGKVLFTGGEYNVRSIDTRDNTKLWFGSATVVRIADKFDSDLKAYIGPQSGSGVDASDIIFYVAGVNGNNGNFGATPRAAQIGTNNTVVANFYVPNGTLWLRENTDAIGSFWARDVIVGEGVQVTLNSFFGTSAAVSAKNSASEFEAEGESSLSSTIVPGNFALDQNYPNPFNPSTTITFSVPQTSDVALGIYNLKGQLIRLLFSGQVATGHHQFIWDGADVNGLKVASGIYVYRLEADGFVATRKLVLAK
jgi:alpha-amylase